VIVGDVPVKKCCGSGWLFIIRVGGDATVWVEFYVVSLNKFSFTKKKKKKKKKKNRCSLSVFLELHPSVLHL
jgi:hypothetical protein